MLEPSMPLFRSPFLATAGLLFTGCTAFDSLRAPRDLACGDDDAIAVTGYTDGGDVVVDSAGVDGDVATVVVTDARGDELTMRFAFDPAAPPLLPATGAAVVDAAQSNCFGEGCDYSWWTLRDLEGRVLLDIGEVLILDEGGTVSPAIEHVSLTADPSLRCGDDELGAVIVVDADGGDVVVEPDDSRAVLFDGVTWQVRAGAAKRRSFVQDYGACADCADPGVHTSWRAEAVLYPVDEAARRDP